MFRHAKLGLTAALIIMLGGCYSDVDSFIVAKAKHDCKRVAECNASFYEDFYDGDMDECRSQYEDAIETLVDFGEAFNKEYDPEQGRKCISATKSARKACSDNDDDDVDDACDRVVN